MIRSVLRRQSGCRIGSCFAVEGERWTLNHKSSDECLRARFHFTTRAPIILHRSFSLLLKRSTTNPPTSSAHCSIFRRYFQTWDKISKRELADLEDRLFKVGERVLDPILERNLASLQWMHRRVAISDDGTLQILLKVPTLLHPCLSELKESVRREAERQVEQWLSEQQQQDDNSDSNNANLVARVNVEAIATKPIPMMAQLAENHEDLLESLGPGLANVTHFLAVYSCKGGVGKSTVAVNLAYEMARMGGRVGLLDLDLYGPSLPVLVRPKDVTIHRSPKGEGMVYPIEHDGVKIFSLGYVAVNSGVPGSGQDNGAAIMRGPMAGKVVTQMLKGTDWGELDVLILDLPPGTGDVQLQVLQDIQMSGAVAVTTPSKLAAVDTRKGIEMFTSLGVPTVSVVENMAYFECGGAKHFPFGRGLAEQTQDGETSPLLEETKVVQLPISSNTNAANDSGEPICLSRPDTAAVELAAFEQLARNVSEELLKMQFGRNENQELVTFDSAPDVFDVATVHLSIDKANETFTVRLYAESGAIQKRIPAAELRSRDPKSGRLLEDSPFKDQSTKAATDSMVKVHSSREKKTPSLIPKKVEKKGRYGYAVEWGDGAVVIYSMLSIAVAAGGQPAEKYGQNLKE